jgi:hypothetical protein
MTDTQEKYSQRTLTGDVAASEPFTRPTTQIYCRTCDEWLLRSRRAAHDEHNVVDRERFKADDHETEPRVVGGIFDVRVSYNITYHRRIAAADEQQAQILAKEETQLSDTPQHDFSITIPSGKSKN